MTSQELNEQRLGLVAQMRAMHDKVTEEKRPGFNAEEQEKYDRMRSDEKAIVARRDELVHIEAAEKELGTPRRGESKPNINAAATPEEKRATPEYMNAFKAFLGNHGQATPEIRATLQKAVTTQGGYLVPIEFETQIVGKMYDANLMRQLATVTRTTSQVNIPMEGNLPTFAWIDELGTYSQTDLTVAQNILGAWKLGGIVTVSEELLQDSFVDLPAYISGRAALAAGFTEESAYILGDGVKKPTGWVTTATASSTNYTSASNSAVTSIDMFNLYTSVSRPYRKNGSYIVADTVLQKLRQEKATTGQYLWQPSLQANAPDVYLGKPIYTSDFLATFAAGSVSAAFGDFSYYQIVDRVGWSMQRLEELYAGNGQVGFRMWERTDGKLLRPEAVSLMITHA
jgi:HK97 family phage major capsid protein